MAQVESWTSVDPATNKSSILGGLPTVPQQTVSYPISAVVPQEATGILVFVWYAIAGVIGPLGYWHVAVNNADGTQNWFSVILASVEPANSVQTCFSQEFWLPMPADGNVEVTFFHEDFTAAMNSGVEIHGYTLGSSAY